MSLSLIPSSVLHKQFENTVSSIEQDTIIVPGEWMVLDEFSRQFHMFFTELMFQFKSKEPYPLDFDLKKIVKMERD